MPLNENQGLSQLHGRNHWLMCTGGGGSFHSQVEHHVRDKFAAPILYGRDNFKFYDIFSTYT